MKKHVCWEDFERFEEFANKYLPDMGEGETMASQAVTACAKLVYKWYNDGDVFDNVISGMEGWCNDLSSYANWLDKNIEGASVILDKMYNCQNYDALLYELASFIHSGESLKELDKRKKTGSIYDCDGRFSFVDYDYENDEDDYYW